VQVKESEALTVSGGAADLVVGDGRLALHTPDTGIIIVHRPTNLGVFGEWSYCRPNVGVLAYCSSSSLWRQ
jgi:hypothetical protein